MIRAAFTASLLTLTSLGCANAIPHALENTDLFGNPRRNVRPEWHVPAGYSQPVEGEGSRIARAVVANEHRQEEAKVVAAEQQRQVYRDELITGARASGCRGDDETCLNAGALREEIAAACDLAESIKAEQADVAYQHSEGRKYGVIDLRELQASKERAESYEDRLSESSDAIKRMRGKAFNAKRDCR